MNEALLAALVHGSPGSAGLVEVIQAEMREWRIGGVAIALVDDQRVVFADGLGDAARDSVFRVGSISKLFNAVAVMREAEAGRLDLDAPLPEDLRPLSPFPGAAGVTLRQILCHRSGLPREASAGGYFDDSEPGLEAIVASVRTSALVTRPGEKTRYSNMAPSLAGHMVERSSGRSFEDYQRLALLGPLGMESSAWTLARAARDQIVTGGMRVADGRGGWTRRAPPLFDLGTIPAGNLFSTVDDLAAFASALLAGGAGVIKPETLREMWRPQLDTDEAGFGLGFLLSKFRGRRVASHTGAVYGYSTLLAILPDEKLAVVALCNEDIAAGRARRMGDAALSALIEAKFGERPPVTAPAPRAAIGMFEGDYESESFWARIEARDGTLIGDISGQPTRFTPLGDGQFAADSRVESATPVAFDRDGAGAVAGFTMGTQRFLRVRESAGALAPEWRARLGSYGPSFIPLVVSERHGHLYAMTENMVDYRLTPLEGGACAMPAGLYTDEKAVFPPGDGRFPRAVNFANMMLARAR
jgi:CubicO group peptidase (beta-lactamase class C family)